MAYQDRLFSPYFHAADFFFFYVFFLLNHWIFRVQKWEDFFLEALKLELFYIDGACQHSGYCCQNITIYKKGIRIDTPSKFNALCKKEPVYTRFTPTIEREGIQHFNCQCLLPNQWCSDHSNRPSLCKNYPASNFISDLPFYSGCGYVVKQKPLPTWAKHPSLSSLIKETNTLHQRA